MSKDIVIKIKNILINMIFNIIEYFLSFKHQWSEWIDAEGYNHQNFKYQISQCSHCDQIRTKKISINK